MADTQRRVPFSGTIRGAGGEAECEGWVTEITLPNGLHEYRQYKIDKLLSGRSLPDGKYTLYVHGGRESVRCARGRWIADTALG